MEPKTVLSSIFVLTSQIAKKLQLPKTFFKSMLQLFFKTFFSHKFPHKSTEAHIQDINPLDSKATWITEQSSIIS